MRVAFIGIGTMGSWMALNELDVPMRMAQLAFDDMSEGMNRGWGKLDSRSPMMLQKERAGVEFAVSAEGAKKTLARG